MTSQTQRSRLANLIIRYCNDEQRRTFSLRELRERYSDFRGIGIGGRTPENTVRRLLQELRDNHVLSFEQSRGHYTLRPQTPLRIEQDAINAMQDDQADQSHGPERREHFIETYIRDSKQISLAKKVFGTICMVEQCRNHFVKPDGMPYIEVHHVIPLCCDGEDALWNLSIVCAHHHRMAHFAVGPAKESLRTTLLKTVDKRLRLQEVTSG